jgi:hypothetical protein
LGSFVFNNSSGHPADGGKCKFIFLFEFQAGVEKVIGHQLQGDQIGRIFACWVIVYFGQCFENYRIGGKISGLIFTTVPVV